MKKNKTIIVLIIIVVALWAISWIFVDSLYCGLSDRGTFGDKFGFVNSLFSGLALAGIIYSIFLQQNELSLQRDELKETRKEFKDQNFQTTFFNLLRTQQKIADDITASFPYLSRYDKENYSRIEGRKFFIKSKSELIRIEKAIKYEEFKKYHAWTEEDDYHSAPHSQWEEDDLMFEREISFTLHTYNINKESWEKAKELQGLDFSKYLYGVFFNRYHFVIGHYFRHLYHILDFLDKSKITRLTGVKSDSDEFQEIVNEFDRYSNFVQAQLSTPEMFLTFYNGLSFPKLKKLLIDYNVLENLPFEDLLHIDDNCIDGINLKSRKEILE